uniref:Uncharacterized protein n=1 Tax=Manihot esculenta TaxID=3983 RepID=A0A2C9U4D1_MANES
MCCWWLWLNTSWQIIGMQQHLHLCICKASSFSDLTTMCMWFGLVCISIWIIALNCRN